MATEQSVNAKDLCAVLENLERRIQILRELFCSMGDKSIPIQSTSVTDVEALVSESRTVSGTGCKPR